MILHFLPICFDMRGFAMYLGLFWVSLMICSISMSLSRVALFFCLQRLFPAVHFFALPLLSQGTYYVGHDKEHPMDKVKVLA